MSLPIPTLFGQQVVINKYELTDFSSTNSTRLTDGSVLELNAHGQVTQIEYAGGATVRRHRDYVLVRSNNSSLWFGDSNGRWYPFD